MTRFLAGVASTLLLIAAGFFLWKGLAHDDRAPLPAAATSLLSTVAAVLPTDPPQATEATREQKRFARYDRNRDGKVDREEYLGARRKAFARLDLNHDGTLSFDEYAAKATGKYVAADADRSGALDAAEFATTRVVRKAKPRCPSSQTPARTDSNEADDG